MPSNRLVCPHCGHDGTPETSRPPLGSFGFNYLAEGVVCREVRGYDDSGRLRLSGDFKCEGSQTTNARIECRSCWRTFPVPEGLLWTVVPEQPSPALEPMPASGETAPASADSLEAAAEGIGRNMISALRSVVGEMEQVHSARIARVESDVADLGETAEDLAAVRGNLDRLRAQMVSLSEAQTQSLSRINALEDAFREQEAAHKKGLELIGEQMGQAAQLVKSQQDTLRGHIESLDAAVRTGTDESARLDALCAQLLEANQTIRQRLDSQAEVIRALHGTAIEQTTRREELRAAVQRLEEIAGVLNPVKPLPEEL